MVSQTLHELVGRVGGLVADTQKIHLRALLLPPPKFGDAPREGARLQPERDGQDGYRMVRLSVQLNTKCHLSRSSNQVTHQTPATTARDIKAYASETECPLSRQNTKPNKAETSTRIIGPKRIK